MQVRRSGAGARYEANNHELGGDDFVRSTDTGHLQQRVVRQFEQIANRVTLKPLGV